MDGGRLTVLVEERVWYWAAGVLDGAPEGWVAFTQQDEVVCWGWGNDRAWYVVRRPISDFEHDVAWMVQWIDKNRQPRARLYRRARVFVSREDADAFAAQLLTEKGTTVVGPVQIMWKFDSTEEGDEA